MDAKEQSDRLELRELLCRYATIPDDRDYDAVTEVFTEDASLSGPGFEMHGREQIAAGMQAIEQFSATLHCVHNHRVSFAGDAAEGEAYCVANHIHEVGGVAHKLDMGIRYRDRYRRVGGRWLISSRELVLVWEQELPLRLG